MEWTVHYFQYRSRFWQSALTTPDPAAYAQQKGTMWDKMAHDADRSFKNINKNYKSPL